ncbi:uncharacterized protein LOC119350555 [Triticum dicoccoides]|uniref:uncharacterized protein LOC119350555 n=1 Tax=Triticum dicoccoides TaxID=85692 RepID=UPI001890625F|nr:uncharacterized protein LOC119350555 [Triticum dicoccoides]XP_044358093.1 uncharacterized protein LOC123079386 [Triticum aestivum]
MSQLHDEFLQVPIICSESPVMIQFVSNPGVGSSSDALSASLSACPSGRSASEVEIEVLFHDADGYVYDDGFCTTLPASAFLGCDGDSEDVEAGGATTGLLRGPSPGMEFVERDGKGELKWSEMEGRFGRSSSAHGDTAGELAPSTLAIRVTRLSIHKFVFCYSENLKESVLFWSCGRQISLYMTNIGKGEATN